MFKKRSQRLTGKYCFEFQKKVYTKLYTKACTMVKLSRLWKLLNLG